MKIVYVAQAILLFLLMASPSFAKDIYIAQNSAGANTGADCADAHAASWFNTATNWGTGSTQIGPGTTAHLCGTFTGAANSTLLTFQGSGTSGSPITLWFESGAVVQAPYFAAAAGGSAGGGISMDGRSYIVIDGNNKTGTVQNSLNGASGATCPGGACNVQATSTLIDLQNCTNCTVQNLNLGPTYIEVQNVNSENSTNEVAIAISGVNNILANNAITNCGWCVNFFYNNNDTNFQAYGNTFSNFGHAFALAPGGSTNACTSPCSIIHDNRIGPAGLSWDASGCPNHKDGIHYFGSGSTSSMADTYIYNNWFGGDWGLCPTGFIYTDNVDPHITSWYMWNNVFQVVNTAFENTNGWVEISAGGSGGNQESFNNTFMGPGSTNNAVAFAHFSNPNLRVVGNVITGIDNPMLISSSTVTQVDYNLYGTTVCANYGNCFSWNGSFEGSLSGWKTACACDAHSISNATPGLNSDGSLQSTSVARSASLNLSSYVSGHLATLQNDTTDGGIRTSTARPTGTTLWDVGAFMSGVTAAPSPSAPTNVIATPK
jgi:hypothetical protein